MAKSNSRFQPPPPPPRVKRKCGECGNCHSHYNIGHEGKPILGRCNVKVHNVLLRGDECGEFKAVNSEQRIVDSGEGGKLKDKSEK
jgi:hypothetical protein